MPNTIDQYREAKSAYLKLQAQAKKDLLARFHELEAEMLQVQRELREDFSVKVTFKPRAGKSRSKKAAPLPETTPDRHPSPKIAAIEKKIATQKRKLEEALKGGKPTKPVQDRIYELEDDLRLAVENG